MRFLFKTDYDQDLRLFRHRGQVFWYSVLAVVLLAAPWWASEYMMTQLHFIGIYSIVGLGLMLLVGFVLLVPPLQEIAARAAGPLVRGAGTLTERRLPGLGGQFVLGQRVGLRPPDAVATEHGELVPAARPVARDEQLPDPARAARTHRARAPA